MTRFRSIFVLTLAFSIFIVIPSNSCTIFILTDATRALFFNNEDYSTPSTHVWFRPGSSGEYGRVYVGFDDGWAQGGLNSEGLAFDWVAGYPEGKGYVPDRKLLRVRGNPSEKMMETCATVEEAIAFYKKYRETSFSFARVMIADKSGASVIIGARNGEMFFDRSTESRGLGYGARTLYERLKNTPEPTVEAGLPILQACYQSGQYETKYSSIYDLKKGEIYLLPFGENKEVVKLDLKTELAKGRHSYDIQKIASKKSD